MNISLQLTLDCLQLTSLQLTSLVEIFIHL
jgi:hypothetical protein